jgi:hypothetical protein
MEFIRKSSIFWDIATCSPLKVNRCFGGIFLDLQCRRICQGKKPAWKRVASRAGSLLGLPFDPEDGGSTFFQNVGWLSTGYTALYPSRQIASWRPLWESQILHAVFLFTSVIYLPLPYLNWYFEPYLLVLTTHSLSLILCTFPSAVNTVSM